MYIMHTDTYKLHTCIREVIYIHYPHTKSGIHNCCENTIQSCQDTNGTI